MAEARPSRRSRQRTIAMVVVGIAVAGLAWALYEVLKVYHAEPNPAVDSREELRLLAERAAGVSRSEGEAAWALLLDVLDGAEAVRGEINARYAAGEFTPRDEYDGELDYDRVRDGRSLPENLEPERQAFALLHEQGVFNDWTRFAAGPAAVRPSRGSGPLTLDGWLPLLAQCRDLARIGASSMRLAAAAGDEPQKAAAVDQILSLSRTLAAQGPLIVYLTAAAIESLALAELRYELMEEDFDEPTLRAVLDVLERYERPAFTVVIAGERIYGSDFIQWSYSDDGAGDGYLVATPLISVNGTLTNARVGFFGAAASRFFDPSRAKVAESYDSFMDRLIEATRLPPPDRLAAIADLEITMDETMLGVGPLASCLAIDTVRQTPLAGGRVVVALELYHARDGRYPTSLDELVPEILPQPPRDPLHGLPFGYRLFAGGAADADGRGYLLYSVGLDGTDDGGTAAATAEIEAYGWAAALKVPDITGADLVLNTARPVYH